MPRAAFLRVGNSFSSNFTSVRMKLAHLEATAGVRLREAHDERPKHAGMPRSVDVGAEKVPFAVHVELVPAPSGIVFPVSLQHSTSPPPSHTLGRQSHCRPHCGYNHAHCEYSQLCSHQGSRGHHESLDRCENAMFLEAEVADETLADEALSAES